ncbi:hypothetical protein BUZ68_05230, partial [Staphylococcus saprophyticus]
TLPSSTCFSMSWELPSIKLILILGKRFINLGRILCSIWNANVGVTPMFKKPEFKFEILVIFRVTS